MDRSKSALHSAKSRRGSGGMQRTSWVSGKALQRTFLVAKDVPGETELADEGSKKVLGGMQAVAGGDLLLLHGLRLHGSQKGGRLAMPKALFECF